MAECAWVNGTESTATVDDSDSVNDAVCNFQWKYCKCYKNKKATAIMLLRIVTFNESNVTRCDALLDTLR